MTGRQTGLPCRSWTVTVISRRGCTPPPVPCCRGGTPPPELPEPAGTVKDGNPHGAPRTAGLHHELPRPLQESLKAGPGEDSSSAPRRDTSIPFGTGIPFSLKRALPAVLSMARAQAAWPDPEKGIPAISRAACSVPSSPHPPWRAIKAKPFFFNEGRRISPVPEVHRLSLPSLSEECGGHRGTAPERDVPFGAFASVENPYLHSSQSFQREWFIIQPGTKIRRFQGRGSVAGHR